MAKVYAPNKEYTGISASVIFVNGVGETDSPALLCWFRKHGYDVQEKETIEKSEQEAEKTVKKGK